MRSTGVNFKSFFKSLDGCPAAAAPASCRARGPAAAEAVRWRACAATNTPLAWPGHARAATHGKQPRVRAVSLLLQQFHVGIASPGAFPKPCTPQQRGSSAALAE